jgi:hypothetical protein
MSRAQSSNKRTAQLTLFGRYLLRSSALARVCSAWRSARRVAISKRFGLDPTSLYKSTVIAVNVGSAVIPTLMPVYLRHGSGTFVSSEVAGLTTRPRRGQMEVAAYYQWRFSFDVYRRLHHRQSHRSFDGGDTA